METPLIVDMETVMNMLISETDTLTGAHRGGLPYWDNIGIRLFIVEGAHQMNRMQDIGWF